ncbi:MAG: sensor histidine kinase [Hyphomicrobiales bacterium]
MSADPTEGTALLHAVVGTSPDAIITIDVGGEIHSFNAAAERLFGYTQTEALGQNVKILMPSHFREQHDVYIARYLATGERHIIGTGRVVAGQHKDGSTFPVELFVGETLVDDARLFVGFIRDLSDLDREHRRVQELQSKLFHASRLGEMGQVASGLVHEVTQPLAAIMNYIQAARRMSASAPVPEFSSSGAEVLEKIAQQAERAVDIIRRLRSFLERRESERDRHDLHAIIEEALALALVGPAGRGVRVQLALMPGILDVHIDRVQIQQVLVNLVRNGIDAMEGMPHREVTISTASHDAGFTRVSVSDVGCGISSEIADELFEEFVTTKEQGLGVGLSISKTIVEAHGGRIWFTLNVPAGATFHFTVPLAQDVVPDRGNPARPVECGGIH